jgi:hypothetical protein
VALTEKEKSIKCGSACPHLENAGIWLLAPWQQLSFMILGNPALLDNKASIPDNFDAVGPYPTVHLVS